MANHAFLYSQHIPDADTVDRDLREFVSTKFPMLVVERADDYHYWYINHPKMPYDGIQMWYQDRGDEFHFSKVAWDSHAEYPDEPEPNINPNDDVLEFRHGHGGRLWWWLECEVRMFLAHKYQCNAYDEGIGEYEEKHEHFESLNDYLKTIMVGHPNFERMVALEQAMIKECADSGMIPDDVLPILGFELSKVPTIEVVLREEEKS